MENAANYLDISDAQFRRLDFLKEADQSTAVQLKAFRRILEHRASIEDSYIVELSRFLQMLEESSFKGIKSLVINALKDIDKQRMTMAQSYSFLLQKDLLEHLRAKKNSFDQAVKRVSNETADLEKQLQAYMKNIEEQRKIFVNNRRECDILEIEYESLNVQKYSSSDKKKKNIYEYQDAKVVTNESEQIYVAEVANCNNFIKQLDSDLNKYHQSLIDNETENAKFLIGKLSKIHSAFENDFKDCNNLLEGIKIDFSLLDPKREAQKIYKIPTNIQKPAKVIIPYKFKSFFEEGLKEIRLASDSHIDPLPEVLKDFKLFYNDIRTSNKKKKTFKSLSISNKDKENLTFLTYFLIDSWNGQEMSFEDLTKFQRCFFADVLFKKSSIAALQHYRLSGEFVLSEAGFKNIANILTCVLQELVDLRDTINIKKLMILSFTFWKKGDQKQDKIYLQSELAWHSVWKNITFWTAAIFLAISEEMQNQKNLNLDKEEDTLDTIEREKSIVFGQLLTFGHNMRAFELDESHTREILNLFCDYHEIDLPRRQLIIGSEPDERKKLTDFADSYILQTNELPVSLRISSSSSHFTDSVLQSSTLEATYNRSDVYKELFDGDSLDIEDK